MAVHFLDCILLMKSTTYMQNIKFYRKNIVSWCLSTLISKFPSVSVSIAAAHIAGCFYENSCVSWKKLWRLRCKCQYQISSQPTDHKSRSLSVSKTRTRKCFSFHPATQGQSSKSKQGFLSPLHDKQVIKTALHCISWRICQNKNPDRNTFSNFYPWRMVL